MENFIKDILTEAVTEVSEVAVEGVLRKLKPQRRQNVYYIVEQKLSLEQGNRVVTICLSR